MHLTTKKTQKKQSKTVHPATIGRKSGGQRRAAKRPAESDAPGDQVTPVEADAATGEAATVHKKGPHRDKAARRPLAAKSESGAPSGDATKRRSKLGLEPLAPEAEIEERPDAVVIRFPPVAPPPFPAALPPAAKVVPTPAATPAPQPPSPAAAPPSAPRAAPAPERTAPTKGADRAPERRESASPPAKPAVPRPPAPPADDAGLSRSQRRRRRRRRHQESLTPTPPPAAPPRDSSAKPAPPPRRPTPPPPPPSSVSAFVSETAFDTADDDPAPWLEDVDVLKSEVADAADDDLEIIEPKAKRDEPAALTPDDEAAEAESSGEAAVEEPAADERGRRRRRRGRRSGRRGPTEPGAQVATERTAPRPSARGVTVVAPPAPGAAAPPREMIINTVQREECRIAILEGARLEEIYIERAAAENHVGNIYKGVVTNVEPSIQAAFIDFGQGKNGFLHISDLHPQYFPDGGGPTENVGRKMPRKNRPPIQRCLRRGQEMLVQVTKEGIGTKGPTLSTYLSIPGRFLVMMPGMRRLGVSRRIEEDESRGRLRQALGELDLPSGMGFIARTAALDRSTRELQSDLNYLTRLWRAVEKRIQNDRAPAELYRESDLVIRTIRDVFTDDIQRLIVDDEEVLARAREFLAIFSPNSEDLVTLYTDPEPIFHKYGIEAELERLHSRHVPLRSGGSLVIDQTEAMVAIDVNSGRFRTEDDAEATAYKINCEAADEVPRQLRLRDLGGVIVCDFIDMRLEAHRRDIERRLIENLKKHKERAKVLRTSAFGLIEMTRQRQRASLTRSVYRDCRHCRGTGLVKTIESVTLDVMRLIQLAVTREHIRLVEITV